MKIMFLALCFSSLTWAGSATSNGKRLTDEELEKVTAGKITMHCDHCDCNLETNICKCTGCEIIIE